MSLSKPKRQLNSLTIAQKVEILHEVDNGVTKKCEIAKRFGIPQSTLSTIIKNRVNIFNTNGSPIRKRAREPEHPDVDECTLKWFKSAREKKIPISGSMITSKAKMFAQHLGVSNFQGSTGWLDKWKSRNGIGLKTICGERGDVDITKVTEWKEKLCTLIANYDPRNIFNADETGLFWKLLPHKTLAFKGEDCTSGKLSKERITILTAANMDGSEKLPLLIIGKSANPRCFRKINSKPVEYASNKKAWMTADLFSKWLVDQDKKFKKEKRKILLFIDNCTAHTSPPELDNVTVIFFPPNLTSVLQPMDQGVIKTFKHYYRQFILEDFLLGDEVPDVSDIKLNLAIASNLCFSAWNKVSPTTISNCFRKAGFVKDSPEIPIVIDLNEDVLLTDGFEDYVNVDENVAVCGELTEDDILADVLDRQNKSSDEEEQLEPEISIIKLRDISSWMDNIQRFFEKDKNVDTELFRSIDFIKNYVRKCKRESLKQPTITEMMKKLQK